MRRQLLAFSLFASTVVCLGQEKIVIVPQFNFMQIDSLVNVEISKHSTDSNFVIAEVDWYVGSWAINEDTNFVACENPFDIYILYSQSKSCFLQHIDNFGYFTPETISADKIRKFVLQNFKTMKSEKLKPSYEGSEHELSERIKVSFLNEAVQFECSPSDSKIKTNRLTSQYKLLQLFNDLQKKYRRTKEKRISVTREVLE